MPQDLSQKQKCPLPLDPPFPSSARCSLGLFFQPRFASSLLGHPSVFYAPAPRGSVTLLCAPDEPSVCRDRTHTP